MDATALRPDVLAGLTPLLERVPGWNLSNLKVESLGGGITNRNYRVDTGGESFVLRVAGPGTDLLGINRQTELAATQAAAGIGVAPQVFHFIEPEGYLVTRFIAGRPISAAEMRQPGTVREVAGLLRRVHELPPIPGVFSPFRVIAEYRRLADVRGVTDYPPDSGALFERAREIEAVFAAAPVPACPCHNDLLNENFLRDSADGQLRILDWEYAGMGDPYFDLANFAAQHSFDDEQAGQLLQVYFGEATPARRARLGLMRCQSDFREAMWGLLQSAVSSLDFDFRGYATRYFERVSAGFGSPRVSTWLAELEP